MTTNRDTSQLVQELVAAAEGRLARFAASINEDLQRCVTGEIERLRLAASTSAQLAGSERLEPIFGKPVAVLAGQLNVGSAYRDRSWSLTDDSYPNNQRLTLCGDGGLQYACRTTLLRGDGRVPPGRYRVLVILNRDDADVDAKTKEPVDA